MRKAKKKGKGVLNEKKWSQDIFFDITVISLCWKLETQYGIDHRNEKHMTWEIGCTSSKSENCDSKLEKSEASFKVGNQKFENAQALNRILSNLNLPIQFKEGNTEVDNLLYSTQHALYRTLNPLLNFLQVASYTILTGIKQYRWIRSQKNRT